MSPDTRDQLGWRWVSTATVAVGDFGNPIATSRYALCIYDGNGVLKLAAAAPPDDTCAGRPCWRRTRSGLQYRDRALTPDGLLKISLKAGPAGRAKIAVRGKGANLRMPAPPFTTPVRVQLGRNDASTCWEARFGTPVRNQADRFIASSD